MFSSQLDKVRHPLASRSRGIVLGSIMMIAAAAALVSARTVAFTFWIAVAGFLIAAACRRDIDVKQLRPGPVALWLGAFLLYALLSATWAALPAVPLEKASVALLAAAGTLLLVTLIQIETRPNLVHMGEGIYIGLLVGVLYLFVELVSDQAIKLWLYRALELRPGDLTPPEYFRWDGPYLFAISREDLTRNMTDAALFLWPTVMAIKGVWRRSWHRIGAAALVTLTVIVVMASYHASSKLALVAGLAAFALARLSLRWAGRIVAFAWVTACLAVIPLVLLAYNLDLHHSTWLEPSARHRVIIWNFTAEKTLEAPWLGIGANMTYVLGPELENQSPDPSAEALKRTLSIHSHSIYLQTWFELGLFGAVLLTLVGLSILGAIRSLTPRLQAYAYATFASAAAMAASSYGMWQAWFMASFGLCAALFALGAQCLSTAKCAGEVSPQSRG